MAFYNRTYNQQYRWQQRLTYSPNPRCSSTICHVLLCSGVSWGSSREAERNYFISSSATLGRILWKSRWTKFDSIFLQGAPTTEMALVDYGFSSINTLMCDIFNASSKWLSNWVPWPGWLTWWRKIFQLYGRSDGKKRFSNIIYKNKVISLQGWPGIYEELFLL